MRDLIFTAIYLILTAGLAASWYFASLWSFGFFSALYFVVLLVDYSNPD